MGKRGTMYTGGYGAAGMLHRDPPKISHSKRKRARRGYGLIVQVVTVFRQERLEIRFIASSKTFPKFLPHPAYLHEFFRFIIPESFRRRRSVTAKKSSHLMGSAVRVKRIYIRRQDLRFIRARIIIDTVKFWSQTRIS